MRLLARVLLLVLLSSFLSSVTVASSIAVIVELRQLVTMSDDIVVGTLQSLGSIEENGHMVGQGNLVVERVIWSGAKVGETLSLRWDMGSRGGSWSVPLSPSEQKSVLWFLTRDDDGSVRVSGQRMTPEDAEMVLDTLAAYPYRVIAPDHDPGEAAVVTIEFRNATKGNLTIPTVRNVDGVVTYGDGFTFKSVLFPETSRGAVIAPRADAPLRYDPTLAPRVLAPGEWSWVALPISTWYDNFPPGRCQFVVGVNGRTTRHGFNVFTAYAARLRRVHGTPAEGAFYVQVIRARAPEVQSAIIDLRARPDVSTSVAPELMGMCDSLETSLRCQVMWVLSYTQLTPEVRIDFFMDRVDDVDAEVGLAALTSAANVLESNSSPYRRDEVVQRLIERLYDENSRIRNSAASALSALRATSALPELQRLVSNDASEDVRNSAQWAIDTIEGRNCCKCRDKARKVLP